MLNENDLMKIALTELIRIFGRKYLQDTHKDTCRAYGMVNESTYMLFLGIKGSKDLPHRKATDKGWVVYGKILLDAITGKVKNTEYVLE